MNNRQKQKIIENAKSFFRDEIVQNHINSACQRASKLSSYNINPFLYKYLANFLTGNDKPESIAKALVLPRILGTSINTSFGMKIQSLISSLFEGLGSTTQGIDIEFIDEIDKRKKYCQLKAGPNTINKDDVVIKVDSCGICSSDLKFIYTGSRIKRYPIILGHEISGTVWQVGKKSKNIKVGNHIVFGAEIPCNKCQSCKNEKHKNNC